MTLLKKTALFATLPLLASLWLTPVASAHDTYWRHRRYQPEWSYSTPYRPSWRYGNGDSGKYNKAMNRYQPEWSYSTPYRPSYRPSWRYGNGDSGKYNKAMNRLAQQERAAQAKAYRRYDGNTQNPHYQQHLAEIDRKYDQKRAKVERNLND